MHKWNPAGCRGDTRRSALPWQMPRAAASAPVVLPSSQPHTSQLPSGLTVLQQSFPLSFPTVSVAAAVTEADCPAAVPALQASPSPPCPPFASCVHELGRSAGSGGDPQVGGRGGCMGTAGTAELLTREVINTGRTARGK